MIEIGCDLNARNLSGETALHIVASKRRLDSLIWLLIEGADVNAKGMFTLESIARFTAGCSNAFN